MSSEPTEPTANGPPDGTDRPRADARKKFSTPMRFESGGGVIIKGHTLDVSPSGAFLKFAGPCPEGIENGAEGAAFLEMKKGENSFEVSFPCVVARITPDGIALNFEEEEEEYEGGEGA